MTLWSVFVGAIPAACLALALGLVLTAPPRYLLPTAICGFAGRVVRDLLVGVEMGSGWATLLAAASVGAVAAILIRSRTVPPVVMISGLLPLGAAGATFEMILGFMRIPSLQGDALRTASVELVSSAARACMTYLALSVGVSLTMAVLQFTRRDKTPAV